jgi:hypothetical protein
MKKRKYDSDQSIPENLLSFTHTKGKEVMIDPSEIYYSQFARLKPFLYSVQRKYIYEMFIQPYDQRIVHLNTDGCLIQGIVVQWETDQKILGKVRRDKDHLVYPVLIIDGWYRFRFSSNN